MLGVEALSKTLGTFSGGVSRVLAERSAATEIQQTNNDIQEFCLEELGSRWRLVKEV